MATSDTQDPDVPGGDTRPDDQLSPEDKERKGVALRRAYAMPHQPMADRTGTAGPVARRAQAWGEPVPQNDVDARALADKAERLIREGKQEATGSDTERPASTAKPTGKSAAD